MAETAPHHEARPQPDAARFAEPAIDVIVVDDNAGVREAACDLLQDEGWHVAGAASAGEALHRLDEVREAVTLVIDLDLGAGMNGLALAAEIMRVRPLCGILLASGGERPAEANPRDAFLEKPFTAEALLGAVAMVHRQVRRRVSADGVGKGAMAGASQERVSATYRR